MSCRHHQCHLQSPRSVTCVVGLCVCRLRLPDSTSSALQSSIHGTLKDLASLKDPSIDAVVQKCLEAAEILDVAASPPLGTFSVADLVQRFNMCLARQSSGRAKQLEVALDNECKLLKQLAKRVINKYVAELRGPLCISLSCVGDGAVSSHCRTPSPAAGIPTFRRPSSGVQWSSWPPCTTWKSFVTSLTRSLLALSVPYVRE